MNSFFRAALSEYGKVRLSEEALQDIYNIMEQVLPGLETKFSKNDVYAAFKVAAPGRYVDNRDSFIVSASKTTNAYLDGKVAEGILVYHGGGLWSKDGAR